MVMNRNMAIGKGSWFENKGCVCVCGGCVEGFAKRWMSIAQEVEDEFRVLERCPN